MFNSVDNYLSLIFNTVSDLIFLMEVTEPDRFVCVMVNQSYMDATGIHKDQLIGKEISEILPEKECEFAVQKYKEAIRTKSPIKYEEFVKLPKKKLIVETTLTPIFDSDGTCLHLLGVAHDITERKQTEDNYKRLTAIVEATTDFVATFDAEGKVLYYNKSARGMLGLHEVEDISSLTILNTHSEWARNLLINEGIPKAEQCGAWVGETALQYRRKREIPVSQVIIAHKSSSDVVEYYSTIARDISDLKCAEERQRLASKVFENISEGVIVTDPEGYVLSVNPAFTAISGYQENDLLGTIPSTFEFMKENEEDYQHMPSALLAEGGWQGEVSSKRKNGELYLTEVTVSPVRDNAEKILNYIIVIKDITERKKTEELLKKSDRLTAIGQMAAGLAHEIRNPLTAVRGFIQLLRSQPERSREYVDVVLSELDRLNFIISELLVLAKPQAVQFKIRDLRLVLESVVTLMETQSIMKNVQIVTQFDSMLPMVKCEENQLKQVFINILKNAIESITNGGHISVLLKRHDAGHVMVKFTDSGCGIPEDQLIRIGEPFYSTKDKGMGLGLMVCSKIIKEHHGSIHITSRNGHGTTVDVILPAEI
ncbi:PAS domain S-box protein [Ferviditalea candida]|uniref:histidine kinase n=1 Tax=Ferviditalea candida TaxID=3108399 RepID=A0ABU5ZHH3_9BACL|nr:PAS domain S-box protein [Paenibacillaceae bacterium T2]